MQKTKAETKIPSAFPEVLTQRQAAKFLGTSAPTLRRALRSGSGIPHQRLGARFLFSKQALTTWLAGQPERAD